ncbi:hypothetical protein [Scardovia wiggsiae]|uniref:hypothetical protein n=1 Tax=Scardovia wiggsiae TaxID=230143 RepID=UPI003BAD905B
MAAESVLNVAGCGCRVVGITDFLVAMAQHGEDRFDRAADVMFILSACTVLAFLVSLIVSIVV